jgi:hypothetical protein
LGIREGIGNWVIWKTQSTGKTLRPRGHESPTNIGTHAYVNPVVAVIAGYFLGGETVGSRILLGTLLVLVSPSEMLLLVGRKRLEERESCFAQP